MRKNKKFFFLSAITLYFGYFCFLVDPQKENLSSLTKTWKGYLLVLFLAISIGLFSGFSARKYRRYAVYLPISCVLMAIFPYISIFQEIHIISAYIGFSAFSLITLLIIEDYSRLYPKEGYSLKKISTLVTVLLCTLWAHYLAINLIIESIFFFYVLYIYQKIDFSCNL